jgi:hypothetical protein
MANRVELWTSDGQHLRLLVAAPTNVAMGHAAFGAATANSPHERFSLRQGAPLIREHPERGGANVV